MDLSVGIGKSKKKESAEAGKEAAEEAVKGLEGKRPDAVIVFASPRFKHEELLEGIRSVAGKAPLIGGTTAGEITSEGFEEGSVAVMAVRSDEVKFVPGIGKDISKGERKAGEALVRDIKKTAGSLDKARTLLIFNDGLAGDGLGIVRGIQESLGEDFEIVGGALGDGSDFKKTYQYYGDRVSSDSVVGLMVIGEGFETFTGVGSGWKSVGNRFRCTKSEGSKVCSFDDTPALDVYTEFLGEDRAKKLPAIGLEYPFGMIDERAPDSGKDYFQIRCPLAVDKKKRTITLAASIPEGKEVTLTVSSREEVIDSARSVAKHVKRQLAGFEPEMMMMFSCVASKMVLGSRAREEVEAVRKVIGEDVPLIGFYTYGEIGPVDKRKKELKQTRWHNETVVLWVLGSKGKK